MCPSIQINYYAMQNVEANFPEPALFWPERWLALSARGRDASGTAAEANALEEQDPLARAFLPYSAGPRSCIGQPLAQMGGMQLSSTLTSDVNAIWRRNNFQHISRGRVWTHSLQVPAILAMVLGRFAVELAPQMGGYRGLLARQLNAFTLSLKGGCLLRFLPRGEGL